MVTDAELNQFLVTTYGAVKRTDISAFSKNHRGLKYCYSFTQKLAGRDVPFVVGLDDDFPLSLPLFFIENFATLEFIPHVEDDGKICYTRDDNVFVDYAEPTHVIADAFELAKSTVIAGLTGANRLDFLKEFEAYWLRLKDVEHIYANLNTQSGPAVIKIGKRKKSILAISDQAGFIERTGRLLDLTDKGISYEKGIFFPVTKGWHPEVLRAGTPITFEYFKKVVGAVSQEHQKDVKKLCNWTAKHNEYVLVSFLQPDGLQSIFGFHFKNCQKHPLLLDDFDGTVTPVAINRLDKQYLVRRGGNGETYFDKRGLVIGCGSVGGFVIEELIRTGFTDLTIIDEDKLGAENSYRHLIGFEQLNTYKVEAIKKRIEKIFPYSDIEAINKKIEHLISNKKIDFSSFSFVVVATGNVTINHYLNELLKSKYPTLPVFFCWNEPYGLGGHVLITNNGGTGCYHCLYDNEHRHNRASFADKNQPKQFLKSISGCGTMYTPFSAIDSRYTACLTAKKVAEVVSSQLLTNGLYSWKGDGKLFVQEGYKLSPRYQLSESQIMESTVKFASPTCPVCKPVVSSNLSDDIRTKQ